MKAACIALLILALPSCSRLGAIGQVPQTDPVQMSQEHVAMMSPGLPNRLVPPSPQTGSLWAGSRGSLLGDRRAAERGDILTVVIEIDDRAEFSNSSATGQSANQEMSIGALFGLPERAEAAGVSLTPGLQTNSASAFSGDGSIRRNEKLTLRVAATVLDVLPNGTLSIQGTQQVQVNYEMRELIVTGFVRPEDISRQNEVGYDKIAAARISYGGEGLISNAQQPPYGQQAADILLPF